jgi:hypothetical protein
MRGAVCAEGSAGSRGVEGRTIKGYRKGNMYNESKGVYIYVQAMIEENWCRAGRRCSEII